MKWRLNKQDRNDQLDGNIFILKKAQQANFQKYR